MVELTAVRGRSQPCENGGKTGFVASIAKSMLEPGTNERQPDLPKSISEIGAGAPDPAACRAQAFLGTQLVRCLTILAPPCPYATMFSHHWFCQHPERERIVARTLALEHGGPPADQTKPPAS